MKLITAQVYGPFQNGEASHIIYPTPTPTPTLPNPAQPNTKGRTSKAHSVGMGAFPRCGAGAGCLAIKYQFFGAVSPGYANGSYFLSICNVGCPGWCILSNPETLDPNPPYENGSGDVEMGFQTGDFNENTSQLHVVVL